MVREGLPELIPNDPEALVLGRFGDRRSVSGRGNSMHKCSEAGTSSSHPRNRKARQDGAGVGLRVGGDAGTEVGQGQIEGAWQRRRVCEMVSFSFNTKVQRNKLPAVARHVSGRAGLRTQDPGFLISS